MQAYQASLKEIFYGHPVPAVIIGIPYHKTGKNKKEIHSQITMIQNLMDRHIPQAVADYRRLHDLDGARADTTKIKHSDVTGKEALLEVLHTVNVQFDDLLDASYHQDGQKLLATNRYLQQRFDKPS